jgi:hypothetical protein
MTEMSKEHQIAVAEANAIFNAILRSLDAKQLEDRQSKFAAYDDIRSELIQTLKIIETERAMVVREQ